MRVIETTKVKIGAHVSAAGKLELAFDRAEAIGAEAIQLFLSGPQGWKIKEPTVEDGEAFRRRARETGISPAFFHAAYLVNLGTSNPDLLEKSVESLVKYQRGAAAIGCQGTIFHVGSHGGAGFEAVLPQVVQATRRVLESSPPDPWLIIENSAGMGRSIGATFTEIGAIVREVGDSRVKVCLDTQHCFANIYNMAEKSGLDAAMEEFDREIGRARLVAVHANDSKCPFGGGLDRHENIGQGHIGLKGFEAIMAHPAFLTLPFLLEVPGFDKKGPDRQNIDLLRRCAGLSHAR